MLELTDLMLVFALFCIIAMLWHNAAFKEQALTAANEYCGKMDVQLLDESMVIKGLWPVRSSRGGAVLRRRYEFEFAAINNCRYTGTVEMRGWKIARIQLDPHPFNQEQ